MMELKHTNNDLLERQNGAGGFAKDSESLKKHIATVLVLPKEAKCESCGFHEFGFLLSIFPS